MLSRSKHRAAHKKLGDLHRRWSQSERLLAPAIELLPQVLIVPVLLFIVGLLDNIISSTIPLSRAFLPIFVAGLVSCAFALIVAGYTVWTVIHGCRHPETSPFQSTLSQFIITHHTRLRANLQSAYSALTGIYRWCEQKLLSITAGSHSHFDASLHAMEVGRSTVPLRKTDVQDDRLAAHDVDAYHSALQQTHEDDIVDHAAAILGHMIVERTPYHHVRITQGEFSSLCYMLSAEASIRANITAAQLIVDISNTDLRGKAKLDNPFRIGCY